MARIRTIKPDFFTSEQVADCSTNARLLFVGLWCFCDDSGVHPASYKSLKMQIFPADDFTVDDIARMVESLIQNGLLIEYEAGGKRYWQVTGWGQHQRIDRPSFRYPLPDGTIPGQNSGKPPTQTTDSSGFDESSAHTRRTLDERHPPEGKGKERKGVSPLAPLVPASIPDGIDLNDFLNAAEVFRSVLGVGRLSKIDQEVLAEWCARYDIRAFVLPRFESALRAFRQKNGGKNPNSLAYFKQMLERESGAPENLGKSLGRNLATAPAQP